MTLNQAETLDDRIYNRVRVDQTDHGTRGLMLKYALDSELMSDADFNAIIHSDAPLNLLTGRPWLLGLVWARCQYERGDGKNVKQVLEDAFRTDSKTLEKLIQALANVWRFPSELAIDTYPVSREQFLSECWLISGAQEQNLGRTSQIWKTLIAVVPELPEGFDKEDVALAFAALVSEDESIPAFFAHLASCGHSDFIESLRALKTRRGEGWLARIAENPIWHSLMAQDNATASWGIRRSGNSALWAIKLDHLRLGSDRNVVIKQSRRELFQCRAVGEQLILDPTQFAPEFDPKMELSLEVGRCSLKLQAPMNGDWNAPALFRQSPHSSFHRLIKNKTDEDGTRVVQARRLFVIVPPEAGLAQFCYGNTNLSPTWIAVVEASSLPRAALLQLDLSTMDRSRPLELKWGERVLVRIGGAPSFALEDADPDCVFRAEPDVLVVFGEQSGVIFDHHSGELAEGKWTAVNCELELSPEKSIVKRGELGQRGQIRFVAPQETPCVCRFRFLPAPLKVALLADTSVCNPDHGWEWYPEAEPYRRSEAAKEGRIRGRVTIEEGEAYELEVKVQTPLWWFSRGRDALPESVCDELCINTLADLKGVILHLHKPVQASILLKLGEATLYEFHDGLNTVRPYELLVGKCDWNSLFEHSGELTLSGEATPRVLARFKVTPPETMLIRFDDGAKVFLAQGDQIENYRVMIVGESALLSGNTATATLMEPDKNGLIGFDLPNFKEHEAAWAILINRTSSDALLEDSFGFCYKFKEHSLEPQRVAQLAIGGDVFPFPVMINTWNDKTNLTDEQRKRIGAALGLIRSGNGSLLRTIFKRYIDENQFCDLIANRSAADEIFERFLEGVFEPADLEAQLSDFLRIGFNWLAEPGWLSGKEREIRTKLCQEKVELNYTGKFTASGIPTYSNTILQPRRNFTSNLNKELKYSCSLLGAVTDIEHGFPLVSECKCIRVEELKGLIKLTFNSIRPAFDPQVFEVAQNGDWVGLHGVYPEGVRVHGNPDPLPTSFLYHSRNQIRFNNAGDSLLRVRVKNENAARAFFVDNMESFEEALTENDTAVNDLNLLFEDVIQASAPAVGGPQERGLGFLFTTCSEAFEELAQKDTTQLNRHFIFQVAVINCLNRWKGWNSRPFPDHWPLHDRRRYRILCALNYRIWTQPIAKRTLMQDMIPIEWLLAWFHY
jgi:hypothetical protein